MKVKLSRHTKLGSLMCGHDKLTSSLRERFNPEAYPDAPPIQICEMKCGCWIVADGNHRVGRILKRDPEATLAAIPEEMVDVSIFDDWDYTEIEWMNPEPKNFRELMEKDAKRPKAHAHGPDTVYGMIERQKDGTFAALTLTATKDNSAVMATASSAAEAERRLKAKVKRLQKRDDIDLVLKAQGPLESHRCAT